MNIKDKLRLLHNVPVRSHIKSGQQHSVDIPRIAGELGGEVTHFAGGTFIRILKNHTLAQKHGLCGLTGVREIPGKSIAILAKNKVSPDFSFKKALFIDTETTGLAGGSGTYAFLVGIGYFAENVFTTEQLFLPELCSELSLLSYLEAKLAKHSGLVSFNGKSYDIPLLTTRFIQNRVRSLIDLQPNFDVLHAARRVWKNDFGNCTLLTLEEKLLQIERKGDVPGEEIPQIYIDYLRSKKTGAVARVAYHNRMDILSMAAVIQQLYNLLIDPQKRPVVSPAQEQRLASLLQMTNEIDAAAFRYENLLKNPHLTTDEKIDTLHSLALLHKKHKNRESAEKCWLQIIEHLRFSIPAAIELAKYYEHKMKNIPAALELTQRCLSVLNLREKMGHSCDEDFTQALTNRLLRLQKK